MTAPTLPTPAILTTPPVFWNSARYAGEQTADIRQLIGWGDSAPAPLGLNAIERIAMAFYDGWIQTADGSVCNMNKPAFKDAGGAWNIPASSVKVNIPGVISQTVNQGTKRLSPAACWACDPSLTLYGGYSPSLPFVPTPVKWSSLPLEPSGKLAGSDPANPDGFASASNIYGWGVLCPPGQRLTAKEIAALEQGSGNRGWCKVQGASGTGKLDLTDPRYFKNADGTWQNKNHIDPADPTVGNLGLVVDVATRPQHGVSGAIDAIFHDVTSNPLGALLAVISAVSLAGLGPILLGVGQIGVVGAVATGHTQQAIDAGEWAVTHPAEVGEVVGAATIIAAGAAVGAKGITQLGTGLLGKGLGDALSSGQTPQGLPGPTGADLTSEVAASNAAASQKRRWWQILGGS